MTEIARDQKRPFEIEVKENGEIHIAPYLTREKWLKFGCMTHEWKVEFEDDTPLRNGVRLLHGQKEEWKEEKIANDAELKTYKYTASVKINGEWQPLDPELIVDA